MKHIETGYGVNVKTPLQARLKLREALKMDFDADLYPRDLDYSFGALCCPIKLTPFAEKKFAKILNLDLIFMKDNDNLFIELEGERDNKYKGEEDWFNSHEWELLSEFMDITAGQCGVSTYEKNIQD